MVGQPIQLFLQGGGRGWRGRRQSAPAAQIVHERAADGRIVEEPVQIGAPYSAVRGNRPILQIDAVSRADSQAQQGPRRRAENGLPHVDLVACHLLQPPQGGLPGRRQGNSFGLMGLLVRGHHRGDIQQPQALGFAGGRLHPQGVGDPSSEHLVAAADPHDASPGLVVFADGGEEPPGAQELHVGEGALGSGEDQQIAPGHLPGVVQIDQLRSRVLLQGVEIGVVGDPGKAHHPDEHGVFP